MECPECEAVQPEVIGGLKRGRIRKRTHTKKVPCRCMECESEFDFDIKKFEKALKKFSKNKRSPLVGRLKRNKSLDSIGEQK